MSPNTSIATCRYATVSQVASTAIESTLLVSRKESLQRELERAAVLIYNELLLLFHLGGC